MASWRGNCERFGKDLIRQITGFQEDEDNFQLCQQFMTSNFRFHRYLDVNSHNVTRELEGLITKFEVHSQPEKANILKQLSDDFLESPISKDVQNPKTSTHYAILSLLVSLANNPTSTDYTSPCHSVIEDPVDTFDWSAHLLEGEQVFWGRYSDSPLPFDEDLSDDDDDDDDHKRDETKHTMAVSVIQAPANDTTLVSTDTETQQNKGFDWLSKNLVDQYWTQKSEEPKTGPYSSSNLFRDWDYYKHQTEPLYSSSGKTFVTETQLIREILWMLAGVEDLFIFQYGEHKFSLRNSVCVSHLTVPSLAGSLMQFMKYGAQIQLLSSFVQETVSQSCLGDGLASVPMTYQAFAKTVSKFLQDFCKHLSSIEKKMIKQEELMTVTLLSSDLEPWMTKVNLVYSVYINGLAAGASLPTNSLKASHLLSVLYNTVVDFDTLHESVSDLMTLLLPMWIQTSRPYLDLIGDWITNGQLVDPVKEFVVQRNENVGSQDENFWENAFVLHMPRPGHDGSSMSMTTLQFAEQEQVAVATAWAPRFLQPVMRDIVLTGKSMEMLESLGRLNEVIGNKDDTVLYRANGLYEAFITSLEEMLGTKVSETPPPTAGETTQRSSLFMEQIEKHTKVKGVYDPLLLINFEAIFSSLYIKPDLETKDKTETRLLQALEVGQVQPIDFLLQQCLYPHIRSRYENICLKLVDILKCDYHLINYLQAMRDFFLMDAGDTMFTFYTNLFDRMKNHEPWRETSYLNLALHEALEAHHPEEVNRLSIQVEDTSQCHDKYPISATDCIKLSYKVPWPVEVVINSKSQELYNQVFSFIMQVKRAKYCLDELRFFDLKKENLLKSMTASQHHPEDEIPRAAKIHKMELLRFRLMYFVNSLHNYIMTRILHSTGLEFKQELDRAVDLDQIIVAHACYVRNIHERCLMHKSVAFLREAFMRVLNLILAFQARWDMGVNEIRVQAIDEMEVEFSRCITFLAAFLNNVIKRGSFPQLESLAFALVTSLDHKGRT
ncbi:gamma-tubulin complex component 5-like [Gigantopelta aegis]|uniref:gamma-tubulin complex component 5-like n=1 Tax=Gigantopelta aegis TaxID=1735272 RepID=UPI001B88C412|nr:gamma-tubulin complex component 5-like [Gigantopelta aegis]XP_041361103.1 gamma-tubulin complex component 5-like [Gigantopelta aegis]XP_041361104.1 gamma-tubulin complex component 5-like [Gigantopelta aegis]